MSLSAALLSKTPELLDISDREAFAQLQSATNTITPFNRTH